MRKLIPMAKLTPENEALLYDAVEQTPEGQRLMSLMQKHGENPRDFSHRVLDFYFHKEPTEPGQEYRSPAQTALDDMIARLFDLSEPFFEALWRGDPEGLQSVLDKGFPINFRDPQTGATALHILASGGARPALRVLLRAGGCDFLVRDYKGRLASELAYLYGRDPAMARLLGNKERIQGEAQGIKVTRRPPRTP